MAIVLWGASGLVKRYFREAGSDQEVLVSGQFKILTIEDDRILAGLPPLVKHNLNSNDAAILATYLRLLRAAEAEGLRALNPEAAAPQDIAGRLAGGAA